MKTIELEKYEVPIKNSDKPLQIDEAFLVYEATRYKQDERKTAYSYPEFKTFRRIDAALAEADKNGKLILEDGDFEFTFTKLKETQWTNASSQLVSAVLKLVDKFEAAKDATNEKKDKEEKP